MPLALARFGPNIPLDGEHMRWGLENLNFTNDKLTEWGVLGMMQNVRTSCMDHTGGHRGKFAKWNGKNFELITKDWIESNLETIWPLVYARSNRYAKENHIAIRNCEDPKDRMYMASLYGKPPYLPAESLSTVWKKKSNLSALGDAVGMQRAAPPVQTAVTE